MTATRLALAVLALTAFVSGCGSDEEDDTSSTGTQSSSSSGTGGVGAQGGEGGRGGEGGAACSVAEDCPGEDTECSQRTCTSGECGTTLAAQGEPVARQTPEDCQVAVCDGRGAIETIPDDADVPDDDNPCTGDACSDGVPVHEPLDEGTSCGTDLTCDGNGLCVGCSVPDDCPGTDDDCQTRTCEATVCGFDYAAQGTPVSTQTPGDCKEEQCDGSGGTETAAEITDLPDDGLDCTDDICNGTTPSNPDKAAGTACSDNGGSLCDGAGQCVGCLANSDCPSPNPANACQLAACTAGTCGFSNVAQNTPVGTQVAGDCKAVVCNGAGASTTINDNADLPNDSNPCTSDLCTSGTPSHTNTAQGTSCGTNLICDGNGACTGCVTAADCPGQDDACKARSCVAGSCGFTFSAAGTPAPPQTAGDCHKVVCDGAGATTNAIDNTDLPPDDALQCTSAACNAGAPSQAPVPAGTSCSQSGGIVCDGTGQCVQCVSASNCPPPANECQTAVCTASACGTTDVAAGTIISVQVSGDCKTAICDGDGGIGSMVADTDLPNDGQQCTADSCSNGTPMSTPLAADTPCNEAGGSYCNATGTCVQCNSGPQCASGVCSANVCQAPTCTDNVKNGAETGVDCGGTCGLCDGAACSAAAECASGDCPGGFCIGAVSTIRVLRVGDGTAALTNASTALFLEERDFDGALVGTIALPTAVSGANQPITLSGSANSEGHLSRSGNGNYITLAGYASVPGVAAIVSTTSAAVNRVVARVDATGSVDTSTLLSSAYSANNVRSATTNDGTAFWAAGTGTAATGGIHYALLGSTGASTQISPAPTNVRVVNVFFGQLYGSASSGTFVNVFTVGTGLPTTGGQTSTSLPGMPTMSGPSPFGFVLFDRNPAVAGVDTLYVADDRPLNMGGGIYKLTFDGATWTAVGTVTAGLTGVVRGLAGVVTGSSVTLFATTGDGKLAKLVDDGTPGPVATVIASAPTNTLFRGVALSPHTN